MFFKKHLLITFFILATGTGSTALEKKAEEKVQAVNLRCEMLTNPLGIDVKQPRLSWQITGGARGVMQTAYQVLVASSRTKLDNNEGDLWNPGKIQSAQSVHVQFGGASLAGRTACYWKVKVWTTQGESPWSEPAYWTMGLRTRDWHAEWIGLDRAFSWDSPDTMFSRLSARYFRKEFSVSKQIEKATVYIAGLGLYELYINNERIGDHVLSPVPTDYTESVMYNTLDVTRELKQDGNAIGTVLGNGRYFTMRQNYKPYKIHTFGYPKMLLQLEIVYRDGSVQKIVTDRSWKVTADGPIRANNEYDGEEYDATEEMPGWAAAGYDDGAWLTPELVEEPGGKLRAQRTPNMKIMEVLKPVSVNTINPGVHILDMGQNMAGWLQVRVKGQRGDKVTLRFAETLNEDGTLFTANLRDAKVTDVYTLKGEGEEVWQPSFVYHGFRYVEIKGYPGMPTVDDFEGKVIYDEMPTAGAFETSDATINQVYKNAYWGIRSNYKGMPVDCPQRNERQPWLGDRTMGAYGESFIFNNATLYAKWLHDIEDSQTAEGRIPDVAPNFWFYYKDNMTWPGAYLTVADMLYRQFGDAKPIAEHYASMKQWLVFMEKRYMKGYLMTKDSYGDWCVPPESQELIHAHDPARKTDGTLIASAYHYYLLTLMQRFATLLNKPEEAAAYSDTSLKVKEAFNSEFLHREEAQYSNNTVTANILPLSFGMVPEDLREKVFGNIVDKILVENNGHISTGVIGTQWLMRTLTAWGRADIAYTIAANRDYPSWGYMAEHGATTIWELWNGDTANPAMNSHNHVMLLGDLVVWYYENLAGIKSHPAHPGFKEIVMNPIQVEGLDYVKASYRSVHGLIKSHWRKEKNTFTWRVSVPPNTKATLYIPARSQKHIKESGKRVAGQPGIRVLRTEKDRVVLEAVSGDYTFESVIK